MPVDAQTPPTASWLFASTSQSIELDESKLVRVGAQPPSSPTGLFYPAFAVEVKAGPAGCEAVELQEAF